MHRFVFCLLSETYIQTFIQVRFGVFSYEKKNLRLKHNQTNEKTD